jgi:anti-sigma factor RsiW
MFMKPFEEKYTAWIDGQLSEAERAPFEQELADRAAAEADRQDLQQLGQLLRTRGAAPQLMSADFFNHQLQQRIETDQLNGSSRQPGRWWKWSIPQLAWAGAACLLAAALFYKGAVSVEPGAATAESTYQTAESTYFAEIVDVRTSAPDIYASTVYTPTDNVTVLWLEGLDYLPATYALQ